jgi:hypothetical protein
MREVKLKVPAIILLLIIAGHRLADDAGRGVPRYVEEVVEADLICTCATSAMPRPSRSGATSRRCWRLDIEAGGGGCADPGSLNKADRLSEATQRCRAWHRAQRAAARWSRR